MRVWGSRGRVRPLDRTEYLMEGVAVRLLAARERRAAPLRADGAARLLRCGRKGTLGRRRVPGVAPRLRACKIQPPWLTLRVTWSSDS